jgi:hypothetical protein
VTDQPVRPRFGQLERGDGGKVPLVFHPTDDPAVFVGVRADTEQPVTLNRGDTVTVDVLGAGQSIRLAANQR